MGSDDNSQYLLLVEKTLRNAADAIIKLKSKHILNADGRDIKLEADKIAEAVIVESLHNNTPFPILSEESGWIGEPKDLYWVVDPLDGSYNFLRGIPTYCSSVALCHKDKPIYGAIYDIASDRFYQGGQEIESTVNNIPVSLSKISKLSHAGLVTGIPLGGTLNADYMQRMAHRLTKWKKVRMFGSANYSLSMVASGCMDCYIEDGIFWWDVAAGLAIISAAGGQFKIHGSIEDPLFIVATNGVLSIDECI